MENLNISDGKEFAAFLDRIHLTGTIQECVLNFNKQGMVTCQAVDLSNAVVASQHAEVGSETSLKIGIGNLSTLCKFFGQGGEFNASVDDLKMVVKRKGHGQVTFQLIDPAEVPTAIKKVDMAEKCESKTPIELKAAKVDDVLNYFNLLGCESVVFRAAKGKLYVESAASDTEQFKLIIGNCKKDMRIVTYAKHLQTVLKQVTADSTLTLYLENDSAIAVMQNEQYWLIAPIEE